MAEETVVDGNEEETPITINVLEADSNEDLLGSVTIHVWVKPISSGTVIAGIIGAAILYKVLKS